MAVVDSNWNVMAHGDAQEGKWMGNWWKEWVASILHTTSEHGVSSITTIDARTSAASSRLNWRPRRFKWTCPFHWKTKSGFFACAITFQLASTMWHTSIWVWSFSNTHTYLGPFSLEPEGVRSLSRGGQSETLLKRYGSHDFNFSLWSTKGQSKVYVHWDQKGSNPLSILFLAQNLNLLISLNLFGSKYILQNFCFRALAIYLLLLK